MIRHKYGKKAFIVTACVIFLIVFSSIGNFSNLSNNKPPIANDKSQRVNDDKLVSAAPDDLEGSITGQGENQTVRFYMDNNSKSYDNSGYFEIPAPANKMKLNKGDFNFTFQNNYTTEYELEDTNALNPSGDKILFTSEASNLDYTPGMNLTNVDIANITDGEDDTYFTLNSTSEGNITLEVDANFTDSESKDFSFNRSRIIALLTQLDYNLSAHANLTLQAKDDSGWATIISNQEVNSSSNPQELDENWTNKNLKYINENNSATIRFIFNRSDTTEFNATFTEFKLDAQQVFELPITKDRYPALEFDLKGSKSKTTVNGFYAWIRTLNVTEAQNSVLNISLYRANETINRDENNHPEDYDNIRPNCSQKIDSFHLENYTNDGFEYFEFNQENSANLSLDNYFIVVKSNNSEQAYSVVTIPDKDYGDEAYEHVLKETEDDGDTWSEAEVDSYDGLDVSQFKLNITRGYMPSDFNIDGNETLQIQNKSVVNQIYEHSGSSDEKWGIGRWTHSFPEPILNNSERKFPVNLTWDTSITKQFKFNVSYDVEAFRRENATSYYNVSYDDIPRWSLNYSLEQEKFDDWNLTQFQYIFPNFYEAHNLFNPIGEDIYDEVENATQFPENTLFKYLTVTKEVVLDYGDGDYSLNLTSPKDIINGMQSYNNYNGTLWETQGFMYGDNISTHLDVSYNGNAPNPGNTKANVSLFFPNGSLYSGKDLFSTEGYTDEEKTNLIYNFSDNTILNVTENIPEPGRYYLGFFWTNGSMVECRKKEIYIDSYDVTDMDLDYVSKLESNVFSANLDRPSEDIPHNILLATVNETTGNYRPDHYPIDISEIDEQYEWDNLPIRLKSFKQNESVLNPEEKINYQIEMQNQDTLLDGLNIKVKVKLVSLLNDEWIIAENTSESKYLKMFGSENNGDTGVFDVNLTMPELESDNIWKGVNAPVRKGGAKTEVEFYIEGNNAGEYTCDQRAVIINETDDAFEGEIIGLETIDDTTDDPITKQINREDCQYKPNKTTIITNIYDNNYMSSYNQLKEEFDLKSLSEFENDSVTPQTPLNGKTFNVSANLLREFGEPISGEEVYCQQYVNGSWVNITDPLNSSDDGSAMFKINTKELYVEEELTLRFKWEGNEDIFENTLNFTVDIAIEENKLAISLSRENNLVYRKKDAIFQFIIRNVGNSTVAINKIEIFISDDLPYSIVENNYIKQENLRPSESISLKIKVEIPNRKSDLLNISIKTTATNPISNEVISQESRNTFTVLDYPISNYFVVYSTLFIILMLASIWAGALMYRRKIKRKIEGPVKKEEKEEEQEPEEKPEGYKKVDEMKEEGESEGKSLDTVLEEEELLREKENKQKKKKSKNAK
ncbi:MAG: hypothetical protein R6U96_08905 [Promethearchaeia archaeon]